MTTSQELAEQAFALLRDALEESESQRLDLEEQLRSPSDPDTEQDRSAESLQAELAELRAERDQWKKTAGQLQDVASNERAKAKRLQKKLGVAEAGSDRVARREVNYWREQAEGFEESRQKFQQRIFELKEALKARDDQLEEQADNQARLEELDRTNELLAERDTRIAELSATIEGLRLQGEEFERRISELDSETRGLSQQVIDAEAARNEACRAADQLDAELKDLRAHAATNKHNVESIEEALVQQRSLNEEYQRRVGEMESQHESEIAALRKAHLDEVDSLHAGRNDELEGVRSEHASELDSLRGEHGRELDSLRSEHGRELDSLRSEHVSDIEGLREAHTNEIAALHEAHSTELGALQEAHNEALNQAGNRSEEFERELEAARAENADELARLRDENAKLRQQLETLAEDHAQQLEHRDAEQRAREHMHASALTKERADALEAVRSEFEPRVAALTTQLDEQSSAFAALEAELAEERHRSDNLNELANERREALTKTTEKVEEMEERYEDAKWHLGKARHFEKLVRRRKKLILNLIRTIRAREKSNNSLKAGLDSLRRYKANADERQQELLRRVEILENSLNESRERLAQANQARRDSDAEQSGQQQSAEQKDNTATINAEILKLRNQVAAQTEVIENLEADLKKARIAETEARNKLKDNEKLHDDLETKNTFIGTLQKDIEEHQKTLAQLRKRDIEVKELRTSIDELERKVTLLKSDNTKLRSAKDGDVNSIDQQKIAEQEQMIGKLTAKLKEYEATINTLSEAADSWKRKYDFIAADAPYGYESASSE
jgi:chromosome segregation ATPase